MRWDELLDLEWEAEWTCMQADWEVRSAAIDLDGERTDMAKDNRELNERLKDQHGGLRSGPRDARHEKSAKP